MNYGGIDNGNKGAFVLLDPAGRVIDQHVTPVLNVGAGKRQKWIYDELAVLRILQDWRDAGELFVVLERAQPMRKQGLGSTFKTGHDFGLAKGMLTGLGVSWEIVPARAWQAAELKGMKGSDTKTRSIMRAQRRFPGLDLTPGRKRTPHDGLADAANMAAYGMKLRPPVVQPRKKAPPPPPGRSNG